MTHPFFVILNVFQRSLAAGFDWGQTALPGFGEKLR